MSTLENILNFLTSKQAIILGAALTLGQLAVIIANAIKKIRNMKAEDKMVADSLPKTVAPFEASPPPPPPCAMSKIRKPILSWSLCNPVNLFRN